MKNGISPDPNTIRPIEGYDNEIYVKPTVKNQNIVGEFTYSADSEFESHVTNFYPWSRDKSNMNSDNTIEVQYGKPVDIASWMELVRNVKWNFPGLETEDAVKEHENTVLKFMSQDRALCVKDQDKVVGVLLFSRKNNMICCLAVKPDYRKRGIASAMMETALRELDSERDIIVSTFREGDEKGTAPRALYRKFGFEPGELVEEFGYPNQVFVLHR